MSKVLLSLNFHFKIEKNKPNGIELLPDAVVVESIVVVVVFAVVVVVAVGFTVVVAEVTCSELDYDCKRFMVD